MRGFVGAAATGALRCVMSIALAVVGVTAGSTGAAKAAPTRPMVRRREGRDIPGAFWAGGRTRRS